MELLIFSDSHGRTDTMREALARQSAALSGICFLGDGLRDAEELPASPPLYAVRGNCDWMRDATLYPTERILPFEGHTLYLAHGHLLGVKSGLGGIISHAASLGADIVLFGHTHRAYEGRLDAGERAGEILLPRPMYLFNPGSIGYDEEGRGYSFGTLLLRGATVLFSHGSV